MYMYLDDRWQRYSKNNKGDAFFLRNSIEMRRLYFHYKLAHNAARVNSYVTSNDAYE